MLDHTELLAAQEKVRRLRADFPILNRPLSFGSSGNSVNYSHYK